MQERARRQISRICRIICTTLAPLVVGGSARAIHVERTPTLIAAIHDQPADGSGDSFKELALAEIVARSSTSEDRAIEEFSLMGLTGLTIEGATIEGRIFVNNALDVGPRMFDFLLYAGNGVFDVGDFEVSAVVIGSGSYAPPSSSSFTFSFDVTAALQALIDTGATHAGLRVQCTSSPNPPNVLDSAWAKLTIDATDPACGNDEVEGSEQCDDGNSSPGDGCDDACMFEGVCGDGVLNTGEQCDDGNLAPYDGCEPGCVFTSIAVGRIYFAELGSEAIYRADPDGTNVQVVIDNAHAWAIEPHPAEGTLYWIGDEGIKRARLDGTEVTTVLPVVGGWDLEIDFAAGKLYWITFSQSAIFRANLDGSGVETVIDGLSDPLGIALAGEKLYFLENGADRVRRANLDGSGVEMIAQTSSIPSVQHLEIDPVLSNMYWMNGSSLRRTGLDGANGVDLPIAADALAIAPGSKLYWTQNFGGEIVVPPVLYRAQTNGAGVQEILEFHGFLGGVAVVDVEALPTLAAGLVGPALDMTRAGTAVTLTWEPSCVASDTDYEVYEGVLGSFYDHVPRVCSTGGMTTATFTPAAGDRYYLIVPRNAANEGSYGAASDGSPRPLGPETCLPQQVEPCAD